MLTYLVRLYSNPTRRHTTHQGIRGTTKTVHTDYPHHDRPMRVLVPLGIALCLSLFGDLTLYAALASRRDMVGISMAAVGIMLGVNRLVRLPANPLAGILLDRWGRRVPFLTGMALGTTAIAGFALAHGFWPFLLTRVAWGLAWTLLNVSGMTMILDLSTPETRGHLSGLYNVWVLLGMALGPLVGGFLVDHLGFRTALLICAALAASGLAVAATLLPETAPPRQSNRSTGATVRLQQWLAQRFSFDRSLLTAYMLQLITQLAGEGIVLSTVGLLLEERFGEIIALGNLEIGVATLSGLLLGLRSLLAAVSGVIGGRISDMARSRWPVMVSSLVAGMAGFVLLAVAPSLGSLTLGVVLGAIGGGAGLASLAAFVGDRATPGQEGAAMGTFATAGDIGSMAGPFLAFALASAVGLSWAYWFGALCFAVGLLTVWHAARRRER